MTMGPKETKLREQREARAKPTARVVKVKASAKGIGKLTRAKVSKRP